MSDQAEEKLTKSEMVPVPSLVNFPPSDNITSAAGRPIRIGDVVINLSSTAANTLLWTDVLPRVGPGKRHAVNPLVYGFSQATYWKGKVGIMFRRIASAYEKHQPILGRVKVRATPILLHERTKLPTYSGYEETMDISLLDGHLFAFDLLDFYPRRRVNALRTNYFQGKGSVNMILYLEEHMCTGLLFELFAETDFRDTSTSMLGPVEIRYEVYTTIVDFEIEGQRSGASALVDYEGWPVSHTYFMAKQH